MEKLPARCLSAVLMLGLALGACRDDGVTGVVAPDAPLGTIGDATLAGQNPYFYLLPPAVKATPSIPDSYEFNPGLLPVVSVCAVTMGTPATTTVCASPTKTYTGASGAVQEVTAEELYQLNWNTEDVSAGKYRIFVGLGDLTFGYFDVEVLAKGSGTAKRNSEDVALKRGSVFPIKFYLAQGAVSYELNRLDPSFPICSAAVDCVVRSVSQSATDTTNLVTSDGGAAVALPPGWFASYGYDAVTVAIVRNEGPCLPPAGAATPYADQVPGCYSYATVPRLEDGFDEQVRVEVCLDPSADLEQYDLWKYSSFGPEQGLTRPEPVGDQLIDCSNFGGQVAFADRPVLRWAMAGWNAIARAIGPRLLYAKDTGAGGLIGSFSEIGWARTRRLAAVAGNDQTGLEFTQLAQLVTVQVTSGHHESVTGIPGIPVTFEVIGGGGYLPTRTTTATLETSADGSVSIGWVLGGAGAQTLRATTAWGDAVVFNASANATGLVSLWPLDGDVEDAVGENDGVLFGTTSFVTGVLNQGLAFSGPNSPAQMTAPGTGVDSASNVTLAGWVKLGANNPGTGIQRFVTLGGEKAVIRLDQQFEPDGTANSLHFYAINGQIGAGVYAPGVLSRRDCFYHVAGTYDGTALRLYLNGSPVATPLAYSGGLATGNGVMFSSNDEPLDGVLDEVRVYNRALSDSEVAALATTTNTAACSYRPIG